MIQEITEWAHLKELIDYENFLWNGNFMSSFSGQLIFNNYELMELWAHILFCEVSPWHLWHLQQSWWRKPVCEIRRTLVYD